MYNKTGLIPLPKKIRIGSKLYYYRSCTCKDFFRIYQGFGISLSSLTKLDDLPYLIKYTTKDDERKYYLTSTNAFKESMITYDNYGDMQKIVRIKEMQEVCLITENNELTIIKMSKSPEYKSRTLNNW